MSQPFVLSSGSARSSVRLAMAVILCAVFAFASVVCLSSARAQGSSRVTSVDPTSGKVNDSVTAAGEGIGKGAVSAIYLSDDKNDYKATIVNQEAEKIVFKVPQVKAGNYNISIQIGADILIQPVKISVSE